MKLWNGYVNCLVKNRNAFIGKFHVFSGMNVIRIVISKKAPGSLSICLLLFLWLFVCFVLFTVSSCNPGWPQNCALDSQVPELQDSASTPCSHLGFKEMLTGRAQSPRLQQTFSVTLLKHYSRTFFNVIFSINPLNNVISLNYLKILTQNLFKWQTIRSFWYCEKCFHFMFYGLA